MGQLIPLTWYEVLPGDTFQQSTSVLIRLNPMVAPVMHPVRCRIHHFFVPNRLIWDDFEDFITGGPDGNFEAMPPNITLSSIAAKSLHERLGVPAYATYDPVAYFSALPHRAYTKIWNEFYRDQDLMTEETVSTASGGDTTTNRNVLNVAWEKDYFTCARPWEQKGDTVRIPVGSTAPIIAPDDNPPTFNDGAITGMALQTQSGGAEVHHSGGAAGATNTMYWNNPNLIADLQNATGISVNELREALAIQRYQEARAMHGSRYVEYLRYVIGGGFKPSDARLQNPEYLGGGKTIIQMSEVLQTQRSDTGETPLGTLGGHGIGATRTNRWRRFFEEHGIVMTLMSVIPKTIYMQHLNKKWLRSNKEEYYQKELEYLGDQPVENREIYAMHTAPTDTFGYQQRYDEYRSHPSFITGEFAETLNYWHLARDFETEPALNQSFVESHPTQRIFADSVSDPLLIMANHSIQARRILKRNPKPRTF